MKRLIFVLALVIAFAGQSIKPANALCVGCSCTVSPSTLTFTPYTFLVQATGSASISYSCTGGAGLTVPLQIYLSPGHGSFAQRTFNSSTDTLNYQLYTSTGAVFGDGTNGTGYYNGTALIGLLGVLNSSALVTGTILSGQSVHSGNYTDSLFETISF